MKKVPVNMISNPSSKIYSRTAFAFLSVLGILFLSVESASPAPPKQVRKDKSKTAKQKLLVDQITLSGIVTDENKKPVQGVKVFIEWLHPEKQEIQTKTDAQGRFTLYALSTKVRGQTIQVTADSGRQLAQFKLPWQNIENNDSLTKLRLQLHPARRVELLVVDRTGKPIANAKTGIMGSYKVWGTGTTDNKGHIQFLVPQDVDIQYVCAVSDGHGVDYKAYVLPRGQSGDQITKPPELPDHPIRLTLDGTQPLEVHIKGTNDKPLAGIKVYPWLLKKPDQPQDLNLSFFIKLVQETTDKSGKAVFQWIPHWQKTPITIWPRDKEHVHQRGNYDPKTAEGSLTLKLEKLVPLGGRVTLPDGSPAKEIAITVSGKGHQIDSFRATVKTDKEGRYTIKAAPNMVYLVVVKDKMWASTPHTGFALWPGKPIRNLDFKLRPATRLFGRVTVGSQQEAVEGQTIYVYQYGQDAHNQKDLKLPNPNKRTIWVQPTIVHYSTSDKNGEFELFVGDGKFDIRGPTQSPVKKFEITAESEKEFNFHAARPEKGLLAGSVVTGNPPQPVPNAEVSGIYRYNLAGRDMKSATDESGRFKVERELHRTVIYARSKDKKLAGVVEIGPDEKMVTIPIRPLGTALAQLIDAKTKEPLQDREISYGVKVHIGDDKAPWRTSFGGTTTTDDEGRLEIRNLVLGQDYDINLVNRPKDQPNRVSWRTIGKVKPEESQPIDLGTLEVSPPKPPYKPPTTEERIAAAFKVKGTPLDRFTRSKRDAKITMQRLLILFGDPKGKAIQELMTMRYEDQEVRKALESFIVMAINTTSGNRDTSKVLAKAINENLNGVRGDFFIVVSNEQGKRMADADILALSADGKINKEKLISFLNEHTIQPLDAQELLATAIQKAKKENKRIIIQETATWCGPCRLLSRFLEKERNQWERDYIWIKMDHRWTGAREIMLKMRDGADGGIPWWAILDNSSKVLVTSNDKDGTNIGFPSDQNGRTHFRTMLEKTAIRLTPTDITTLVDALNKNQQ
ncbi:hypothetical protein [Gimesia aquarii]|nr:hypothetical protein [Gimesia aquarii]